MMVYPLKYLANSQETEGTPRICSTKWIW